MDAISSCAELTTAGLTLFLVFALACGHPLLMIKPSHSAAAIATLPFIASPAS
jgi:hypothetical protein